MWARIEPYLPDRSPQRSGRWAEHREVIEAIAWKYRTGSPWRDLPDELGSWKGAYSRFRRGRSMGPGNGCWPKCRPAPMRPAT